MRHTNTHERILLSHKKEWNTAICSNVTGPKNIYWNKSEKDKYCMIQLTCGILKNTNEHNIVNQLYFNKNTSECVYKTERDSQI